MSFHVQTDDIGDENRTATASWDAAKPPAIAWTTAVIVRVSAVAVLMLLIMLGNVVVVATIASRAELRHKHVNVFVLNLAVGDLIFCLVATERIPSTAFDRWIFGPVACKLVPYVQLVTIASTTFLLTAMSVDRYQVRIIGPVYTTQPVVKRLSNQYDNRLNVCIHDSPGFQTYLTTGWTTGCIV